MKIYDVSLPISPDLPVWPGDPAVVLEQVSSMDAGAHDNISRLACGVHTGTHVDAPHHFLNDHRTVESLALDILVGPALVLQIPDAVTVVDASVLEKAAIPAGTLRLLLKTSNSSLWERGEKEFFTGFVGISADGADWLVQHGLKLVGIDYLSVAPYHQSIPTHRALLAAGIIIVEGLDLSGVQPGTYTLYCL
ncbi:MAG: cyclase family protein, partial [Anaerolineales bacterium]